MSDARDLAIIIPVYNEADNLPQVLVPWLELAKKYNGQIICINDGSRDNSLELLNAFAQNNKQFQVIDQTNAGHGSACLSGYQFAIDQGFKWIFQTDSDGQTDPDQFSLLWSERTHRDYIFGKRENREDGTFRLLVTCVLRLVLFLVSGRYLPDANVPFRLMRAYKLKSIVQRIPPAVFLKNALLTLIIAKENCIKWVPISFGQREAGLPSVSTFQRFVSIGWQTFRDFVKYRNI